MGLWVQSLGLMGSRILSSESRAARFEVCAALIVTVSSAWYCLLGQQTCRSMRKSTHFLGAIILVRCPTRQLELCLVAMNLVAWRSTNHCSHKRACSRNCVRNDKTCDVIYAWCCPWPYTGYVEASGGTSSSKSSAGIGEAAVKSMSLPT